MITIDVPQGPAREFHFMAEERVVKGPEEAAPKVATTVLLCEPHSTPMTGDLVKDDLELKAFFEAEKDKFRFDLVRLDFTLNSADVGVFDKAWLEVKMTREDEAGQADRK